MTEEIAQANIDMDPRLVAEVRISAGLDQFEAAIADQPNRLMPNAVPDRPMLVPDVYIDPQTLASMQEGCSVEAFSRYVGLRLRAEESTRELRGTPDFGSGLLGSLEREFPQTMLRDMFQAEGEDGIMHRLAAADLSHAKKRSYGFDSGVKFLMHVYDVGRPTDLLSASQDTYRSGVRKALLTPETIGELYIREHNFKMPEGDEDNAQRLRSWMRDVTVRATGMSAELADRYVHPASRIRSDGKELADIITKMDALGPDKLAAIAEFSKIYALHDYSVRQLERMNLLAEGDPAEIARLQELDTIVMFSNRQGDHNNVLSFLPEAIDDEDERTVLSEFESFEDVAEFMAKLRMRGIKPYAAVFGAHTKPGEFQAYAKPELSEQAAKGLGQAAVIHSVRETIRANAGDENKSKNKEMRSLNGMTRMLDHMTRDFMQPSRDKGDPDEGKIKIAFISCDAATKTAAYDVDPESNQQAVSHETSVVEAIAEGLARSGANTGVQVYGADFELQGFRTPEGLGYTESAKGGRRRRQILRYEVNGSVVNETKVDGVVLRRPVHVSV